MLSLSIDRGHAQFLYDIKPCHAYTIHISLVLEVGKIISNLYANNVLYGVLPTVFVTPFLTSFIRPCPNPFEVMYGHLLR